MCLVEPVPTLWHIYRMLGIGNSQYRAKVVAALRHHNDAQFAKGYWQREFPMLIADRGYAAQALNPPRNKINVLTPSVARMLAEGRSAGLEALFAWQYSAQIRDDVIRSGVRSLLQSMSIFRMREMEDAR